MPRTAYEATIRVEAPCLQRCDRRLVRRVNELVLGDRYAPHFTTTPCAGHKRGKEVEGRPSRTPLGMCRIIDRCAINDGGESLEKRHFLSEDDPPPVVRRPFVLSLRNTGVRCVGGAVRSNTKTLARLWLLDRE